MAIPLFGYRGKKLNVFGPFINYTFYEDQPLSLFVQLMPRFQSFKASDDPIFDGMATRKKALEAGFGYRLKFKQWQLKGSTLSELFGTTNGTEIKTSLSRRFQYGPFFMTPSISASYLSNDHVDYYYGVKSNEATSERGFYKGLKTVNQSIGFTFATPIFFGGMSRLSLTYTHLGDTIQSSPLVDEQNLFNFRFMFTKFL